MGEYFAGFILPSLIGLLAYVDGVAQDMMLDYRGNGHIANLNIGIVVKMLT